MNVKLKKIKLKRHEEGGVIVCITTNGISGAIIEWVKVIRRGIPIKGPMIIMQRKMRHFPVVVPRRAKNFS